MDIFWNQLASDKCRAKKKKPRPITVLAAALTGFPFNPENGSVGRAQGEPCPRQSWASGLEPWVGGLAGGAALAPVL